MIEFLQQYSIPFAVCGCMLLMGYWRGRQHNSIKKLRQSFLLCGCDVTMVTDEELVRSIELFSSVMRKCGVSLIDAAKLADEIVPKTLILKSSIERIENPVAPNKPDFSNIKAVKY